MSNGFEWVFLDQELKDSAIMRKMIHKKTTDVLIRSPKLNHTFKMT